MTGLHTRFTVELYVAVKRIHFKYSSLKLVISKKRKDLLQNQRNILLSKAKLRGAFFHKINLTGGRFNKLSPQLSLTLYSLAVTIDPSEYFFSSPSRLDQGLILCSFQKTADNSGKPYILGLKHVRRILKVAKISPQRRIPLPVPWSNGKIWPIFGPYIHFYFINDVFYVKDIRIEIWGKYGAKTGM